MKMEIPMTTEERLDKLERKYRLLVLVGYGLAPVLAVAFLLDAPSQDVKDTISARQFIVIDENGTTRMRLSAPGPSYTGLVVYDFFGKRRAILGVDEPEEGWGLKLFDKNEALRFWLEINDLGPNLEMYDKEENLTLMLDSSEGSSIIGLVDKNQEPRVVLGLTETGPGVVLFDKDGNPQAELNSTETGSALLLYDKDGTDRAVLRSIESGPGLMLFDKDGKTRVGLHSIESGSGIVLFDENGKPIWTSP